MQSGLTVGCFLLDSSVSPMVPVLAARHVCTQVAPFRGGGARAPRRARCSACRPRCCWCAPGAPARPPRATPRTRGRSRPRAARRWRPAACRGPRPPTSRPTIPYPTPGVRHAWHNLPETAAPSVEACEPPPRPLQWAWRALSRTRPHAQPKCPWPDPRVGPGAAPVARWSGCTACQRSALHARRSSESKALVSPLWTPGLARPALDAPRAHRGPADVTAAALRARTDAQTPTVHATANSGANGAARRTAPGNARFSPAPAATGSSTTCRGARLPSGHNAAQVLWAERWQRKHAQRCKHCCVVAAPDGGNAGHLQRSADLARRRKVRQVHAGHATRQASTLVDFGKATAPRCSAAARPLEPGGPAEVMAGRSPLTAADSSAATQRDKGAPAAAAWGPEFCGWY